MHWIIPSSLFVGLLKTDTQSCILVVVCFFWTVRRGGGCFTASGEENLRVHWFLICIFWKYLGIDSIITILQLNLQWQIWTGIKTDKPLARTVKKVYTLGAKNVIFWNVVCAQPTSMFHCRVKQPCSLISVESVGCSLLWVYFLLPHKPDRQLTVSSLWELLQWFPLQIRCRDLLFVLGLLCASFVPNCCAARCHIGEKGGSSVRELAGVTFVLKPVSHRLLEDAKPIFKVHKLFPQLSFSPSSLVVNWLWVPHGSQLGLFSLIKKKILAC